MIGVNVATFQSLWNQLAHVFLRRNLSESQRAALCSTYYDALAAYVWPDVEAGGQRLLETWPSRQGMPAPADWITAIAAKAQPGARYDLPVATEAEVRDITRAQAGGYAGESCGCLACVTAGLTADQPPRYVPFDPPEPRRHPRTGRPIELGEWLHGERLLGWYQARARFYAAFRRVGDGRPMVSRSAHRRAGRASRDRAGA